MSPELTELGTPSPTPPAIAKAQANRQPWTQNEPTYADLSDELLLGQAYHANINQARESLNNYPSFIPRATRLDDMIARGLLTYKFVVDFLLEE